jgi:hypothetical protein
MAWEVTLKVLKSDGVKKYKVTRRMPEYYVAETKVFDNKEDALKQFNEWLQ